MDTQTVLIRRMVCMRQTPLLFWPYVVEVGQDGGCRAFERRQQRCRICRNSLEQLGASMKRIILGLIVVAAAAAILVPLAVAGGNSDNAKACQQGGWQTLARQDNTGFNNQDGCVSYAAHGGVLKTKP